jgi:hypothetical protein
MWIKYGVSNVGYAANYAVYGSQPAPSAPTTLSATAPAAGQIRLTWTDSSTNEAGFKVERGTGSGWTQVGTTGSNVTTYTDSGLPCGTSYSYRVRAYNTGGDSGYSAVVGATTFACPTATPAATPTAILTPTVAPTPSATKTPVPSPTPAPPTNDSQNGAKAVVGASFSDALSTTGATSASTDPMLTCAPAANGGKGYATVWYQIRPTANGKLSVSTDGSNYGNAVAVWQSAKGKLNAVSCSSGGNASAVTVNLLKNTTYYIEVAATAAGGGNLRLNATYVR